MLTILNWQTRTVPPMPQPALRLHISVRVELKSKATVVDSVAQGKPIAFTCTPENSGSIGDAGEDGKTAFLVRFTIAVAALGDFVRIIV